MTHGSQVALARGVRLGLPAGAAMLVRTIALATALAAASALLPEPRRAPPQGGRTRDSLALLYASLPIAFFAVMVWSCLALTRLRGLWLDEYGTLWVVSGTAREVAERVYAFQGQSPLYYYAPWIAVHLFNTSELTLRLPSMLFVLIASFLAGCTASVWYGRDAAIRTSVLVWSLPPVLDAAVGARPYSLALVGYACAWLGYARAVNGRRFGSLFYILGGTLLFWAHYLLAIFLIGIVAAHLLTRPLRDTYSVITLFRDTAIVALCCFPGLPHLVDLWRRREALDWMPSPDILAWVSLLLPSLLVLALVGMAGLRRLWTNARVRAVSVAVLAPLALIYIGSVMGPNLTAERYLLPAAFSGLLCAVAAISTLTPRGMRSAVVLFVSAAIVAPAATGSLAIGMTQDWTSVRRQLDTALAVDPDTLILFRSGFVEEDSADSGSVSPVDLAPLKPPGFAAPAFSVIPLTYTWNERVVTTLSHSVLPALRRGCTAYFVSTHNYSSKTGSYGQLLSRWLTQHLPQLRATVLSCCRGVEMIRFDMVPAQTAIAASPNCASDES